MMKIIHVITGMQKAAGTSVFCGEVCNGLIALDHEVTIAVTNPETADRYPLDQRIRLISISSLLHAPTCSVWHNYGLIHIHALWAPLLHKVAKWARQNSIPVVWSPHGMLTPWAINNKKWKKLLGWWLYQKRELAKASLIHATAQSEVDDIRRMGLKNKVIVAPLGMKVGGCVKLAERVDGKNVLLFVSRVQRKKGLENLVRAWVQLPLEIKSRWVVRIVGPDQEGHTAELKVLCAKLSVENDFEFVGPKYGDDLAQEYANADLFVLPTYSENFGSVVIESLAHGVPVICTKGAPWKELDDYKCGWWIDIGVEPLTKALKDAMSLTDIGRSEMGARGKSLIEAKYTWNSVVRVVLKGYEEVLGAKT